LRAGRHYFRNTLENDVRHLLVCEPAYETDQRYARTYLKIERALKFRLAKALTRNVVPAIAVGKMSIRLRVPQFVVDAIENATEIVLASPQHPVQSKPEFRRQNLARISGAYCRNLVAAANCRLEIGHLAVELDAAVGKMLFGYANGR